MACRQYLVPWLEVARFCIDGVTPTEVDVSVEMFAAAKGQIAG